MFPVMTLVKAPPRTSRPMASVAPLTTASVTTSDWRKPQRTAVLQSSCATEPAVAGEVRAVDCTDAGSRAEVPGGAGPCAHGIRSALCRMTLGDQRRDRT